MSPVAREISLCYALLINFVAAGASRVSGDGVRRSLFAAGSARHIASSGQRRSEGNSQRGSWTVAYKTPSGFALPPGRLAGASTIRGSQSSCVQVIHRRRPSCSRWTMSTAASTPSYDKGSMVSEDSDVAGSTQSPAKEKQADMKVTLLSGFLGAGKTTLMRNIIRQARKQELSLALIVNDMVRGACTRFDVEGLMALQARLEQRIQYVNPSRVHPYFKSLASIGLYCPGQ